MPSMIQNSYSGKNNNNKGQIYNFQQFPSRLGDILTDLKEGWI